MKTLSCGILVLNARAELLLCRATGTFRWDIPKGGSEPGESPLRTALRETAEECGLHFAPHELLDLGRHAYRPGKDLHLYGVLVDALDPATACRCSSHFTDLWGRRRPEMDAFEWTTFERVPRRCARRMTALLTHTLSLPALLQRLAQRAGREQYARSRVEGPAMESSVHNLSNLFEQLGLPGGESEIARFVAAHRPLADGTALADAPFWSAAQAQFLREEIDDDADWAEIVDQLNLMLRA